MPEPTPVTLRLGIELRAHRTMAGLSQRDLATQMNRHTGLAVKQPRVHRIEIGEAVPTRGELDAWLRVTIRGNASDEALGVLGPLLVAAHNPTRPWHGLLGEENQLQSRAGERELSCRLIRNVSLTWIPGLLQTAEYARQLLRQVNPPGADLAAQVAGRIERQQVLYQGGRRFEFLIGEQALVGSPGPDVMDAQLGRLESLATLANVEIAVLPSRRVGAVVWHDFIYREPAVTGEPYVDGELLHAEFATTDPASVARYLELWDRLWSAALSGDDAVELIRKASDASDR